MTRRLAWRFTIAAMTVAVAVGGAVRAGARPQDKPPVFRGGTELVSAFVSVRQRNQPVAGLVAQDFVLIDNNVRQMIDAAWIETLPIDVTLVLDTSGSLVGPLLQQLQKDAADLGSLLRQDDRVRVLVFSTTVQEVFPMARVGTQARVTSPAAGGATSFFNAIAAGLLAPSEPGRPHLVLVFSDGGDNTSWLDDRDVRELAGRTNAVLYTIIRSSGSPVLATRWLPWDGSARLGGVGDAAGITGGKLTRVGGTASVMKLLTQVVEEFRTSYVLWYQQTQMPAPGWHELKVTVPKGNYDVSARRGYFADRR